MGHWEGSLGGVSGWSVENTGSLRLTQLEGSSLISTAPPTARDDLKLLIVLLAPPKCWDYSVHHHGQFMGWWAHGTHWATAPVSLCPASSVHRDVLSELSSDEWFPLGCHPIYWQNQSREATEWPSLEWIPSLGCSPGPQKNTSPFQMEREKAISGFENEKP